jgi:hypothetical protein
MDTPAVADGPIAFVTDDGQQRLIPLSAISFAGDAVKSTFNFSGLQEWLNYLVSQGRLSPGSAPTAAEAMVFTAAVPGVEGNDILIEVTSVGPTAVIKVTETHVAKGLTFDSHATNYAGAVDGLVSVTVAAGVTATDDPDEKAQVTTGATSSWQIKAPPSDAAAKLLMTLDARTTAGIEKGSMTIGIGDVKVENGVHTFTLTAQWTCTRTIAQGDLVDPLPATSPLRDFAFAVTVAKPSSGPLALPKRATILLRGGAERVPAGQEIPAKSASATLLANS